MNGLGVRDCFYLICCQTNSHIDNKNKRESISKEN